MPKLSLLKTSHSTTSGGTSSGRALEICAGAREIALYLGLGQQISRWPYKGTAKTAEKKRITKGRQNGWRGYRVHRELYTCFPWLFILNYRYNMCLKKFLLYNRHMLVHGILFIFWNMSDVLLVLRAIHLFHMFARPEQEAKFAQKNQLLHMSQLLYVRNVLCLYIKITEIGWH